MNILLVHSTRQHGHDPVVYALRNGIELLAQLAHSDASVTIKDSDDRAFSIGSCNTVFDLAVVINASRWYALNRLAIRGNPKAALCSFTGDDVHSLLNSLDLLVSREVSVFTSCYALQQQLQNILPVVYALKPVVPFGGRGSLIEEKVTFGCVLPNIADRDFSLVEYVVSWLKKKYSVRFPIIVPEDDAARLPKALEEWRTPVAPEALYSGFSYMRYYIPALRLTDLKTGIVPFELWQALAEGLGVLLPRHPLLGALAGRGPICFVSLNELDAHLERIVAEPGPIGVPSSDSSVVLFLEKIWKQCVPGGNNATPAGTEVSAGQDSSSVSRDQTFVGSKLVVEAATGDAEF